MIVGRINIRYRYVMYDVLCCHEYASMQATSKLQQGVIATICRPAAFTPCRRVECTPPADMKLSILDNRGAGGWIRLSVQVRAPFNCQHCVPYGCCRPLQSIWYANAACVECLAPHYWRVCAHLYIVCSVSQSRLHWYL
jgi:hypothetical protein